MSEDAVTPYCMSTATLDSANSSARLPDCSSSTMAARLRPLTARIGKSRCASGCRPRQASMPSSPDTNRPALNTANCGTSSQAA